MRAALLVLAVTAAPAHADREPAGALPLTPVAPAATLALETEPCVRGLRARSSRVIGTARVTVVHDCEGDAEARSGGLAIRSADRWFFAANGLVALERVSSNIIRRVTFAREHLDAGVLASGATTEIYTIETINGTAGALRFGRVLVCTVRAEVACTEPLAFACEIDSCRAPRLSRGVLIVHDADEGEQRYTVSAAAEQ